MKLFAIGHEDTVLGLSLAGIEGLATQDAAAAVKKLEDLLARHDLGLILITPRLATLLKEQLEPVERLDLPLVLQVPAPEEPLERPPLQELVRRALGVKA